MPKMYNPETQETAEVDGPDVRERKDEGWVVVGNRPPEEYVGKTADEIRDADEPEDDAPPAS